ncbi:MAG: ketopantoate reductase family protein [Promethearchaeota archaeon]
MKLLIFGAGAMGSLFGGLFALKNHEVILLGRGAHIETINQNGLMLQSNGITSVAHVKATCSLKEVDNNVDFVIISTKAFDLASVCKKLRQWENKSVPIIILQNGLGNEEIASNYLKKDRIHRILTSEGALLKKPGLIEKTGHGSSLIGWFLESSKSIEFTKKFAVAATAVGLPCQVITNLQQAVWEKLVVNSAINPVGALTELKNGEIIEQDWGKQLLRNIARETVNVAQANNIKIEIENPEELPVRVASETKDNICSMLADIKKGQPTEIKYINNAIVEVARKRGIEAPLNTMLTALVTLKEQKKLAIRPLKS